MVNHRLMSHQKDKPSTSREYHCGFCANHDLKVKKTNHRCGYMKCPCILCNLTRTSQNIMKKQQAVWRELNARINKDVKITGMQYCDKCRNHSILTKKRYHKPCSFESCTCKYCFLTDTRRKFMRLVQRIKRANVTCKALTESPASHQSYSIVGDDSNVTDSIKLALADAYRAMTNLPYFNGEDSGNQLIKDEHILPSASNYTNKTEFIFGRKKEEDMLISKQKRKSGSSSDVNIKKIRTPTSQEEACPDYHTNPESTTTTCRDINSLVSKESESLGNSLNEIPQNYFAPLMNGIEDASLTEEYSFDYVLNESQGNSYSTIRSSTNPLGAQQQCDDYASRYPSETATSMNSGSSTSCVTQVNKFFEIDNDSQKNLLESSYCSKSDPSPNIEKNFDSNFSLSSPTFSDTISTSSLLPDSYQQIIVQNIQPSSYLDSGQANNEYKSNHPVSSSVDKDVKPDISDVKTSVEELYNLAQFSQNALNVNSLNFEDITADSTSLNYNVPDNTVGQSNTIRDGNGQASTNKKEQLFPPYEMSNDNPQKSKGPDISQSNLIEVGISKQSNPSYMQANYRDTSFVNNTVIPYADITHSNFTHHNFRQVDNVADRRSFLPNRDYNPYLNISDAPVPFATTYQNTSHCSDVTARNKTANSSFSQQSSYLHNSTLYNPQCFNFASDSTSGTSNCKVISMNSQAPSFGNYPKLTSMRCPNIDGIQSLPHNSSRNYGCVDASNQLCSNKATVAVLENQNSHYSQFAYSQYDGRFSVQSDPQAFVGTRQQYDKSPSETHPPYGPCPRYPPGDQQSTSSSGSGSLNLVSSSGSKNSPLGKLKSMSRSFLSKK